MGVGIDHLARWSGRDGKGRAFSYESEAIMRTTPAREHAGRRSPSAPGLWRVDKRQGGPDRTEEGPRVSRCWCRHVGRYCNEELPEDTGSSTTGTKKEARRDRNRPRRAVPEGPGRGALGRDQAAGFNGPPGPGSQSRHRRVRHRRREEEILDRYSMDAEKIEKQYQARV